MANKIKVRVVSVSETPGKINGKFVHKLKTEGETYVDEFGNEETKSGRTYFISLKNQNAVGTEVELDLDNYDIREYPYDVTDENTGEMQTIMLKWLHRK